MNYLGSKLRELRAKQELLLREVATKMAMDIALLSKIERGERRVTEVQISKIATILKADPEELKVLWLADKLTDIVQNEPLADKALLLVKNEQTI